MNISMTYPPRVTEVDLIKPHKHHSNPASGFVRGPTRVILPIQASDNKMANPHPESTTYKDGLTSYLINEKDSRDCSKEQEDSTNPTGKQGGGIACEAQVLEDELQEDCNTSETYLCQSQDRNCAYRCIIKDGVDSAPWNTVS